MQQSYAVSRLLLSDPISPSLAIRRPLFSSPCSFPHTRLRHGMSESVLPFQMLYPNGPLHLFISGHCVYPVSLLTIPAESNLSLQQRQFLRLNPHDPFNKREAFTTSSGHFTQASSQTQIPTYIPLKEPEIARLGLHPWDIYFMLTVWLFV